MKVGFKISCKYKYINIAISLAFSRRMLKTERRINVTVAATKGLILSSPDFSILELEISRIIISKLHTYLSCVSTE